MKVLTKDEARWWVYIVSGVCLLPFIAPALISAHDTVMVLLGILLLVIYAVWSWKFWIKRSVHWLLNELNKDDK